MAYLPLVLMAVGVLLCGVSLVLLLGQWRGRPRARGREPSDPDAVRIARREAVLAGETRQRPGGLRGALRRVRRAS